MPHQCLKCGKVFEEGSPQLLKGCPKCGGNRFFYTKKPLDEKERDTKRKKMGKDVNSAISELMENQNKEVIDEKGNWVNIKPKEVRKAVKKQLSQKEESDENRSDIHNINDDKYRKQMIEKIQKEMEHKDQPETIDIEKTGSYGIDLKGLLEEEPIIIQKDGSYTIHLPSAFKINEKTNK
ncbi:MAG: Zn-ribbon containing protein [Candidatus Thermoplasmatota archaeon]